MVCVRGVDMLELFLHGHVARDTQLRLSVLPIGARVVLFPRQLPRPLRTDIQHRLHARADEALLAVLTAL
jgi:hypothetical protein